MGEFTNRVLTELKEIKDKQSEHTVQLKINTHVLNEHHVRASQLESRLKPIEEHVVFQRRLLKTLTALIAVLAGIATIVKVIH